MFEHVQGIPRSFNADIIWWICKVFPFCTQRKDIKRCTMDRHANLNRLGKLGKTKLEL